MKATREALGDTLARLGAIYPNLIALDADLAKATKLDTFKKKFPDRVIQCGIAEANMIGMASGLSEQGFKVFLASFGSFLTGRYDTIRCSIAYSKAPVILVGTHGGLAIGRDGVTQMAIEDLALMTALPNMAVYNPASYTETCLLIEHLIREDLSGPVYLRLGRQPVPELPLPSDITRTILRGNEEDTYQLTVFSTGCITHEVVKALQDERLTGLQIRHIHVSRIKAHNGLLGHVDCSMSDSDEKIVTVEDHTIHGGFGSAIQYWFNRPVTRVGVPDKWASSGKPEDLYKHYRLDAESISSQILRAYYGRNH